MTGFSAWHDLISFSAKYFGTKHPTKRFVNAPFAMMTSYNWHMNPKIYTNRKGELK
jgi:hypothetical protein